MSTRSGKRIHRSFHENTEKTEALITRSVQKTKSKHSKENVEVLNVSSKLKRRNYVAYPSEEDKVVDTVDSKGDGKTTRTRRKDALKEQNFSSIESVDPAVDTRKSMRSTKRTRKFAENAEEATEASQDEKPSKVELPKPKKDGKKKKKAEKEQVVKEVVSKTKSKKKKGRQSGSIMVQDISPEAINLNKSNMSVDSYHSAAGSPWNTDIETAPLQNIEKAVDTIITTTAEIKPPKSQARKTRSSLKLVNTLTNDIVIEEEPRKQKLSTKMNSEGSLNDATGEKKKDSFDNTSNREQRRHKTSIIDTVSRDIVNTSDLKNSVFDKTLTPNKINTTFENYDPKVTSANKRKKRKSIVDETDVNVDLKADEETVLDTTFEKEAVTESARKGKKRKSAINAIIKIVETSSPFNTDNKRKSVANETSDNDKVNVSIKEKKPITNATFGINDNSSLFKSTTSKLFEDETQKEIVNTTYEKDSTDSEYIQERNKLIGDVTFELASSPFKSANDISSFKINEDLNRKSVINTTYEKDSDTNQETNKKSVNTTFDRDETKINASFDIVTNAETRNKKNSSQWSSTLKIHDSLDIYIDQEKKLDTTFDKSSKSSLLNSDNSMITLDKSDASRISITSDESKENILNTTPLLIESSLDESKLHTIKIHSLEETTPKTETKTKITPIHSLKEITPPKMESEAPITPLKREGTFTKDEPKDISSPKPKLSISRTPTKQMSLPSAGFTPFHVNKSSTKEKRVLNVTRSIEKRRSSLVEVSRTTKVMFCSPVNNPVLLAQNRRKVIKSNLKGSNKSFIFDESVSETRPSNRKRSYTQSDADEALVKRKRLTEEMQHSVNRLSRPRTSSVSAKLAEPTTPSKKPITPSKKSDVKKSIPRTKLPNFAAMHQKQFDKMESLNECQERRAKRAKLLRTPTGASNMLERISPKDKVIEPEKAEEPPKKPETPIKSLPTFKSLNPGYTRFGFKLNLDVNPFSIPSKPQHEPKKNEPKVPRPATLPSLAGATASARREIAKQTVMREKSFTDRRNVTRTENRTIIKGVRTNRRFDLQMRMRDL